MSISGDVEATTAEPKLHIIDKQEIVNIDLVNKGSYATAIHGYYNKSVIFTRF